MSDHVAESSQVIFPQHSFHRSKYAGDLAATSQHFFVGHIVRVLRPGYTRNGQFPAFESLNVFLVFLGADQFVMTMPHELEQVFQELAHAGGANEVFQIQLAKAPAQVDPEILIVEHAELSAIFPKKVVAVFVKGCDAQSGQIGSAQLLLHSVAHLLSRVLGVSDGENFVGPGMAFANQTSDALGENSGLSRACASDHQHGPVDVFDRFALALVRVERPWFGGSETRDRFCDSH